MSGYEKFWVFLSAVRSVLTVLIAVAANSAFVVGDYFWAVTFLVLSIYHTYDLFIDGVKVLDGRVSK